MVFRFFFPPDLHVLYAHVFFVFFFDNLIEKNSRWKAMELYFHDKTEER